jgi:hypothetical protein
MERQPVINEFSGEYRWLSNFWACKVSHDGILYSSVEHAFQAAKTLDFAKRWEISQLEKPGEAKRAGRQVVLRPDWEQIKDRVMMELVLHKFAFNADLKHKLLATGNIPLVEGNTWNDTYWGICLGKGENKLGRILMAVRDRLRT